MTFASRISLLPIDSELDHNGRQLRIIRELGEGFTSVVYEGVLLKDDREIKVAIKAMKPLDFADARARFRQEGETLMDMMEQEEPANKLTNTPGLQITPLYHGLSTFEDTDYFVMEFVNGLEIPDVLRDSGVFSEKDALKIGWQFFRTLDVLHTGLKKTFVDLKMENLWWAENEAGNKQLKITDLGTLADVKPDEGYQEGVHRDLLLGGIILLNLLTGYTLRYSVHGLQELVQPLLKAHEMSWGTEQFIRKALHRSPKQRFSTAGEMMAELFQLETFWHLSNEELYDSANANLSQAVGKKDDIAKIMGMEAHAALDILQRRAPEFEPDGVQSAIRDAQKILSKMDYLGIGIDFFLGGRWKNSKEQFEKGKHWSEDPAVPRRWSYLASAMVGHKFSREELDKLRDYSIQTLERMGTGNWPAAITRWDKLRPYLNPEGVEALIADCNLFDNLQQAQEAIAKDEYAIAVRSCERALMALKNLPSSDQEFIQIVEIGDLENLRDDALGKERTRGKAQSLLDESLERLDEEDYSMAVKDINIAVRLDPENPKLSASLMQACEKALSKMQLAVAHEVMTAGLRSPFASKQIWAHYQLVNGLWKAERFALLNQYDAFNKELQGVMHAVQDSESTRKVVTTLLRNTEKQAKQTNDISLLRKIHDLVSMLPYQSEWAGALQINIQEMELTALQGMRNTIDRILAEASHLLYLEDVWKVKGIEEKYDLLDMQRFYRQKVTRFEKIVTILDNAERMGLAIEGYKKLDVDITRKKAVKLLENAQRHETDLLESIEAQKNSLEQELAAQREHFIEYEKWYLKGLNLRVAEPIQTPMSAETVNLLRKIAIKARQILIYDEENSAAQKYLTEYQTRLTSLGKDAWEQIAKDAQAQAGNIRMNFKQTVDAFESGDFDLASTELERLRPELAGAPEWRRLWERTLQVEEFRVWQQENASDLQNNEINQGLLDKLQMFALRGMPRAYWDNSLGWAYLQSVRKRIRMEVKKHFSSIESNKFARLLCSWLIIENAVNKAYANESRN